MPKRRSLEIDSKEEVRPIRKQLDNITSYHDVVSAVSNAKNIVVLCGAGISTSSGIPDFRSRQGIYELVEEMGLPMDDPQLLFDLEYFKENPEPFFQFAHKLYPDGVLPSPTHYFLSRLEKEKKLRRVFTQNIDGLEQAGGVSDARIVCCHGSLSTVSCLGKCKTSRSALEIKDNITDGSVAYCENCGGIIKPDVTFFGESLNKKVKKTLNSDKTKADLLLVLGTSLKVQPMSHLVNFFPPSVPQILINLTPVTPLKSLSEGFDVSLLGSSDLIVTCLMESLGWAESNSSHETPQSTTPRVWSFSDSPAETPQVPAATVYEEVITCDMCASVVETGFSCAICFDYDLCPLCYNHGKNTHRSSTKHKFVKL